MEKYNVGDIIYVIPSRDMTVIALRVDEELVRKTKDAVAVTYMVTNGKTSVSLDDIKGHVFKNPSDCRDFLIKNAISSIDTMIEKAVVMGHDKLVQKDDERVYPPMEA